MQLLCRSTNFIFLLLSFEQKNVSNLLRLRFWGIGDNLLS